MQRGPVITEPRAVITEPRAVATGSEHSIGSYRLQVADAFLGLMSMQRGPVITEPRAVATGSEHSIVSYRLQVEW